MVPAQSRAIAALAGWVGLSAFGCVSEASPPVIPETPVARPAQLDRPPVQETSVPLGPLTSREQRLSAALREVATRLVDFGERNVAHEWELAAATDYIASSLEAESFDVIRHGFTDQGRLAQSLEVLLPGKQPEAPAFVVAARFDSALGSPGADDAASGAAALLVLARELGGKSRERSLRLVFLSDASNRTQPTASGAPTYLAYLEKEGVSIAAMLELSGLGAFRSNPGTQKYPEYSPAQNSTIGDFIALGGYAAFSPEPMTRFFDDLKSRVSLPIKSLILLPDEVSVANSPHRFFAEKDVPSFILFDTHRYRDVEFGGPNDTVERLDFDRMARVIAGLADALQQLVASSEETGDAASEEPG